VMMHYPVKYGMARFSRCDTGGRSKNPRGYNDTGARREGWDYPGLPGRPTGAYTI